MCNLVSIAVRVGAPRIVRTRGIPHPAGDPSLPADRERELRGRLVERALQALCSAVQAPTVFEAGAAP
jgi:betaine reductase